LGYAFLPRVDAGSGGDDTQIEDHHFLLDATTGEILFQELTTEQAETAADIQGVPVILPDGTPFSITVRGVEDGGTYYLKNIDKDIDITTYNGGGSYDSGTLEVALNNNTLDICQDTDDDFDSWTTSCVQADRDDSQQPEIDAHNKAAVSYDYYLNHFEYKGFDNELYGVGTGCPVRMISHTGLADPGAVQGAAFVNYEDDATGNRHGFIKIRDGRCDGGSLTYDFNAGDHCSIAHEYQHALTYFGVTKSTGDPAYLYGNTIFGAFREGMSDSFGGLISGTWILRAAFPEGVAIDGADPLRIIEFPRDPDQIGGGAPGADHYDEIGADNNKYYKSTILSHLAFLLGSGGIHERAARGAQYIPVPTIGANSAARIWHEALMDTFDTLDDAGGDQRMIDACNLLLEKAVEIFGDMSKEYVLLRRGIYAVGVYPYDDAYVKQSYGGEACMIPWGNDWRRSHEYLPLDYYRWKSQDLFIDNGDGPVYDAGIGQENKIYARVRNIGDQDLSDIRVEFYYRKYGSALPTEETDWRRCQDEAGTDCTLLIDSLPAESNFFGEADYTPDQAVNWYLDPDEVTDEVGHFCLRAVIYVDDATATNHQNDYVNRVQSNVQHIVVDEDGDADAEVYFVVANPKRKKTIPLEIELEHTLPKGAILKPLQEQGDIKLKPGEELVLGYRLHVPAQLRKQLLPPYEGELTGEVYGELTGHIAGKLVQASVRRGRIRAKLRARIGDIGNVIGTLEGNIDRKSRQVKGKACVLFTPACRYTQRKRLVLGIVADLNPKRCIEFTQIVGGEVVGGVTVDIRNK
jgi:Zn-dependent metalloprotease